MRPYIKPSKNNTIIELNSSLVEYLQQEHTPEEIQNNYQEALKKITQEIIKEKGLRKKIKIQL